MNQMKSQQLQFNLNRPQEADRNYEQGGRSFYFFDFDDNIINLLTPIVLFHKNTKDEKLISTHELAEHGQSIGISGIYADYKFDFDDSVGSYRFFRDSTTITDIKEKNFTKDIYQVINKPQFKWKGPSWKYFHYATFNQRPLTIITARGHSPEVIRQGINILLEENHIEMEPNYLAIYPVSNPAIKQELGDEEELLSVSELKKLAIIKSVEKAIEVYGDNPLHRFGMSDDDAKNIELITEAMLVLKKLYKKMSFFVIDTQFGKCIKKEIFENYIDATEIDMAPEVNQISMFD